jgi:integrase
MGRRLRDAKLDTRSARAKLTQRREPYWRSISGGLALGYRKGATGGTWIAKHYSSEHGKRYHSLGAADDVMESNGTSILDFARADAAARRWLSKKDKGENVHRGPYTVAKAMEGYLAFIEAEGRAKHTLRDARYRDAAFITAKLGKASVAELTSDQLRRWRDQLVKAPPRLRTRKGHDQKYRDVPDEDAQRARRASANRTWTILRAALNYAFAEGKTESDLAWRKVKPFKAVDAARVRYLTLAEVKRLVNACDPDFRLLVQAALQTGARYGELTRLAVCDYNYDAGTVAIRQSKSGKPRQVVLTDEGRSFFRELTAGRQGNEPMLKRDDGMAWDMSHQIRRTTETVARAKINPGISFHGLRHTWASHAVMGGMPLMIVARNLGHADTRMVEKHYGHLAPSFISDSIRKHAPRFGYKPTRKLAVL